MKNRNVLTKEIKELDNPIELKVITKLPEKWLLTDLETGEIYQGTNNTKIGHQWKKIKKI